MIIKYTYVLGTKYIESLSCQKKSKILSKNVQNDVKNRNRKGPNVDSMVN